jgi:hypothetical protein
MTPRNYLYLLKKYDEYQVQINRLLESIVTSIAPKRLLNDEARMQSTITSLHRSYPFVELLYVLDNDGVQITNSAASPTVPDRKRREPGLGSDRSNRVYYSRARDNATRAMATEPYLSNATHQLSISATQRFTNDTGETCYFVINFNLEKLITFLNGDSLRRLVHPVFQVVYGIIGIMLMAVAGSLLFSAGDSLYGMLLSHTNTATHAFQSVVLITLGLAIFDLGKTIVEEEVLLHKDIHHTGSTRRTIARFMSAIVIAVSIESLLLMFKSILSDGVYLNSAVWMLLAAVALLVGLGVYLKLTQSRKDQDD